MNKIDKKAREFHKDALKVVKMYMFSKMASQLS